MPPSRAQLAARSRTLSSAVEVFGLNEAVRLLELAPPVIDQRLQRSLVAAVQPAVRDAIAEAPRSPKGTADLAHSVRARAHTRRGKPGVRLIAGGSKAPYAPVRMFGKQAHVREHTRAGAAVRAYTRHMTNDPFLIRAGERHRETVRHRITNDLARILDEVFGG